MTMVVLVCAIFAALSAGVLFAYALCFGMFQVFRIHSLQAAQQRAGRAAARAMAATGDLITG